MLIVEEFFKMIKEIDGFSAKKTENGIVFIPPKSKYFYMPRIVISDLVRFKNALDDYISTVENTNIRSTKMDKKHDVNYFLFCLIKNLSNYDYNNFEEYIEMYTQFIRDKTFSEYNQKTKIGMLDERTSILVRRTEEYYGAETPYVMKTFIKNNHIEYELPLIRYGISENGNKKTACIYMIQRKRQYVESKFTKEVDKLINQVNSGVKNMRDVTPSMIFALTLFLGMIQREGIKDIIVPDFLPRRYAHFQNINSEEQRDKIQSHATEKFLKIFLRLQEQLDGFVITAFPNDIDSSMHICLSDNLKSKNKLLNRTYLMGYNGILVKTQDTGDIGNNINDER